jgi:hypothetical protein
MNGVLNEHTRTVHKRRTGASDLRTVCGVARTLDSDQLRTVPLRRASVESDVTRCGRCFEDAGGY